MPSSSLVEVEVEAEVGTEVRVEVGVEVEVYFAVGVEVKVRAQNYFFGVGGCVDGWRNGE